MEADKVGKWPAGTLTYSGLSDRVKGWDWTEEYGGLLNQNPMEEK